MRGMPRLPIYKPEAQAKRKGLDCLTAQQELLVLMASEGMSSKEIAEEMMLAESTVKQYFHLLLKRTHSRKRTELVARYVREGK
jgi:DNA-binding NarL/FixJ family response regulator